jgi:hypothetical protein
MAKKNGANSENVTNSIIFLYTDGAITAGAPCKTELYYIGDKTDAYGLIVQYLTMDFGMSHPLQDFCHVCYTYI